MRKITGILMSVLVLMGLTASSCGGGTTKLTVDADEVVASLLAAQVGITTYRVDLSVWLYQYSTGEGLIQELTLSMDASAVVDEAKQQMEMDMTTSVAATGQATVTTRARVFLLGDYLYTGTASSSQEWSWTKEAMSSGYWDKQEALDMQLQLIEGSRRKIQREENVDGVDCYVLELTPNLDQLWSVMTQLWTGEMSNVSNPKDVIKGCSVTQWVAKDTSFLSKGVLQMNLHLGSDDMVETLEMKFHDYNEPVSIQLPSEAES